MSDEYSVKKSRRKKKKNRRKKRIVLFVMELLILACLAVGVFVFAKVNAGLRNFQQLDTADENQNMDNVQMNEGVAVDKVMSGYTNILLLGLDHREDESFDYCNSDTMMICSINNDNGEVRLVSVYRDTYLNINPETYDFQKANAAYCWGSAAQCISMINKNLDLNITDYVAVDFKALAVLVDDIGGIDVTLTELEIGLLRELGQIPFLPVARQLGDLTPVYLESGDREQMSLVLQALEKKGLISLDYDKPLPRMETAYAAYPIRGSMALTERGQKVLELMEYQGIQPE